LFHKNSSLIIKTGQLDLLTTPAGSTNAKFYINTDAIKKHRQVTLQDSRNGSSVSALLNLKP
jgi:hypothetical protein